MYAALGASVRKLSQETFNLGHFGIHKTGLMELLGKKKSPHFEYCADSVPGDTVHIAAGKEKV